MEDDGGDVVVDAALALMAEDGFDDTTMGQIADAAGLPLNRVTSIFATKDAIVFSVVDDIHDAVVVALSGIDTQISGVDALQVAYSRVLSDILAGLGPIPLERMRLLGIVMMKSRELQQKVMVCRDRVLSVALGERLGVPPDDKQVRHELKLWSAVVAGTLISSRGASGHFDPDPDARRPERMRERLSRSYQVVSGRRAPPHR